jgi:hypothetical protein
MGLGDLYQPGEREAEEQFDTQGHAGLKGRSGQTPEELAAYNAAERRRKQTGFKRDTDPTNREELMRNLAGREGSPSMQGAQAAGTTVGGAAQVDPTGQIQAGQLTGAGIGTLGQAASGQTVAGGQWAADQAQRAILAGGAKTRGRENIGLAARSETQARGLAAAQLAGEQEERQLAAAAQEAELRLREAGMSQEAAIAQVQLDQDRAMQNAQFDQETTVLQAQLQQQLNLSNAEFQQRANEINLQVETQLSIERDKRMNELMRMGVDEDIARMKAEEEAWKFKSELMFNYWNAALQDELTRDVTMKQEEGMFDDDMNGSRRKQRYTTSDRGGGQSGGGGGERAEANEKFEPDIDIGENFGETFDDTAVDTSQLAPPASPQGAYDPYALPEEPIGFKPVGEMSERDYGTKASYEPSMEGPRDVRGAEVEEQLMEAGATYDRRKDAAIKVQSTLDTLGKVRRYGGAAFDILSGDEEQAKAGAVKLARGETEGALTQKLSESGLGKLAGPAVATGGALIDTAMDDSKKLSTGDKLGYNLRKAAASSGGAAGGAALGSLGGGALGGLVAGPPGALVGAGVGGKVGGTLGAMGTSALDEELFGSPTPRTILPGGMVASKMSVDPSKLQEDPLSISGPGKVDIGEDFESPGYATEAPRGGDEAWHTEWQPPHSAKRGIGYDTQLGTPITAAQRIDQLDAFLTRLANKEAWEYGDQ